MKNTDSKKIVLSNEYKITSTQRGLILQCVEFPSDALFHSQIIIDYSSIIKIDILKQSFTIIAEKHDILRTSIDSETGLAKIHEASNLQFQIDEIEVKNEEELDEQVQLWKNDDFHKPFNLMEPFLWRVKIVHTESDTRILWSFHYIILDDISANMIINEVLECYKILSQGRSYEKLDAKQMSEYVEWLNELDQNPDPLTMSFWKEEMANVKGVSKLPWERTQLSTLYSDKDAPLKIEKISVPLSKDELISLDYTVSSYGLNLEKLVQGAWALLLGEYHGMDEVIVGITSSGRSGQSGLNEVAGCLIRTLPLRVELDPQCKVKEWLLYLAKRTEEIYEHEHYTLAELYGMAHLMPGENLFNQVIISVPDENEDSNEPAKWHIIDRDTYPPYALTIEVKKGICPSIDFRYDTRCYERSVIERVAQELAQTLDQLCKHSNLTLGELQLIPNDEWKKLVVDWNNTDTEYTNTHIQSLFEKSVSNHPDSIALLYGNETRTYVQVEEQANRIANYLLSLGSKHTEYIAILTERSIEMIPALLGVLKASGCYIPIDPGAPIKRWNHILESMNVRFLLTQASLMNKIEQEGVPSNIEQVILLDSNPYDTSISEIQVHLYSEIMNSGKDCPELVGTPNDPAYVIFTSGTTGTPKGVVVSHAPAVNLIEWVNKTFEVGCNDRVLFVTSLTFDLSVYDIFGMLASGGSIRIAKSDDIREPSELVRYIREEPITFWDSAPAALMQILPYFESENNTCVSEKLRLVFMSGDWVPLRSPAALWDSFPNVKVVSLGGATEATIWSNYFVVDQVDPGWASIPYGHPIQNAKYLVLDKSLRPCPIEVPGDLYIGGLCLSEGYANDPGLTSEKFIASPYEDSGRRLYRTGDTVRWRENGTMEFMGRTDTQVKIRGYRIELGEIDSVLAQHNAVADCATLVREEDSGNRSLVSYVVFSSGADELPELTNISESRVDRWCHVYDNISYQAEKEEDFSGWSSSYTGLPLSYEEMVAWRDEFASFVLSYHPQQVLEIGCGTGLILSKVAPKCERYVGIDFSSAALESARSRINQDLTSIVQLQQGEAESVGELNIDPVDVVIINSVIQYFPNSQYLCRVLDGALNHVKEGGCIILGDVRSLPLLKAFHASVAIARSQNKVSQATLRDIVMREVNQEQELVIDPYFFQQWAKKSGRICRVEITPEYNTYLNEMTMFRYQVVLHVGEVVPERLKKLNAVEIDWSTSEMTLDRLKNMLLDTEKLRVTSIPNIRVDLAVRAARWILEEDENITIAEWCDKNKNGQGIDPNALISLGNSIGFTTKIDWSRHGSDGGFDAYFSRDVKEINELCWITPADISESWMMDYANDPIRLDTQELIRTKLKEYLTERLPSYMIPTDIISLESMPVTSSGKLDRRALLAMNISYDSTHYTAPRTITEKLLIDIWKETLSYPQIGIEDSFFKLGGNSLLAVRLAKRIKDIFAVNVPVRTFFEHPTVAEVAQELVRIQQEEQDIFLPPIEKASQQDEFPASFEQQRIYFIQSMNPEMTAYTVNWIVPLPTDMEHQAIRRVLNKLVERHEVLRSTLHEREGRVWQVISPHMEVELPCLTVADAYEAEIRIKDWWEQPYDLEQGPLIRAMVISLDGRNQCVAMGAHHTVFDGYSISLFIEEFKDIALNMGANQISDKCYYNEIQYGDYATWQHNMWLRDEFLQYHLDYWKKQLNDAPERLELPRDYVSPSKQSFAGDVIQRRLTPEQCESISAWSSSHQVTDYITLLSVFFMLMSRLSGQDVVVIGVPIANRNRPELEKMIGFLVSSVPICVNLKEAVSFEDIVCQVRGQLFDGQAHQEIPLERLIEFLHPSRDLSYNPIFQVMCADESLHLFEQSANSMTFAPWMRSLIEQGMSVGVSRFDLTLMIQKEADGIHLNLEYCTDLFMKSTVEVFMDRFVLLLDEALSDSKKSVGLLPLLMDSEKKEAFAQYKNSFAPLPSDSLDKWFLKIAAKYPDRVAISSIDGQITYGQVAKLSTALATLLKNRGISRGSFVGICATRSVKTVISILGIVIAGAAYVPLDPSFPKERLAFMIDDVGVSMILTFSSVVGVLPKSNTDVVVLEDVWDELLAKDINPVVLSNVSQDDLAYVIYTSGSTGKPKGVAITHKAILTLGHDSKLCQHDVVLIHSPLAFDASTYEMWVPLISGGRCYVADLGEVMSECLKSYVSIGGLTCMFITAALFHLFAAQEPSCFSGLREVWTGGEAVHADALRAVQNACPTITVVDVYGPTETCAFSTCHLFKPGSVIPEPTPIGQAIDRYRLLVLDSKMQAVPIGIPGELYIGGPSLARGYIKRPELTSEVFVADPYAEDGSRLYRTGDRVRLLPNGDLEWMSRIDQQVKIRGFRIEPAEVEQVLEQHPSICQAVVLVDQDGPSKRLVAFLTLLQPIVEEAIQTFASEHMPSYMVPGVIMIVDALPLGPTGKVDRKALYQMIPKGGQNEYVKARTKTEEKLANVWGDVLGLGKPAGIYDDFFSLGGDSILSLQVIFRARQEGIYLTVNQLFEHPLIAELALVVEIEEAKTVQMEQGIVTGITELTPIQHWFFRNQLSNPHYFNQSVVVEVPKELGVTDWKQIVSYLIMHHDVLRTRFLCENGKWSAQITGMLEQVPIKVIDMKEINTDKCSKFIQQIGQEVQASLRLDRAPLLNAVLFDGGEKNTSQLLLVAHHLVVDVVSWRIILDDLMTLIHAACEGEQLALPEKTSSWQLWATRINSETTSIETMKESIFWETQTVTPEHGLPLLSHNVVNTVDRSGVYDALLDVENTQALLQEIPAVFGTQINDVLLTAVGAAIGSWSDSSLVRFDLEGHGREALFDDIDVSRTVGWFTTISPVLIPAAKSDTLVSALKNVKELMKSRPRHGIGYGLLYMNDTTKHQPAEVSFNYLGQFDDVGGQFIDGMGMAGPDWDPCNERPYLIDIVGQVIKGQLHINWNYSRDAFSDDSIVRVAEQAMSAIRDLIIVARNPMVQGYTPSDFPACNMTQKQIDNMITQVRHLPAWKNLNIPRPLLDCYPQTPIQQGLLFQSKLGSNEGIYHVQAIYTIEQNIDTDVLYQAWVEMMRRYAVLKTSFWDDEMGQAFQLVWDLNKPPIEEQDWSNETDYNPILESYLNKDRVLGFDSSDIPQWHILLAKTTQTTYIMILSIHHAIIDGWSLGVLLNDLTDTYDAILNSTKRQTALLARPYRDYITWLGKRDREETEIFWRTYLKGFAYPTPLPQENGNEINFDSQKDHKRAQGQIQFKHDFSILLGEFVKENALTMNTVFQGAFAMLLGRYTGMSDVLFGTVVSGRTNEVKDIERMVGLFINTLPLRVSLPDHQSIIDWLHDLQETNLKIRQYEHTPLNLIRGWTEISSGAPLFDILFDFENYPMKEKKGTLNLKMTRSEERVNYSLGLVVIPGEQIEICMQYDTSIYSEATIDLLLNRLMNICQLFVINPNDSLGTIGLLSKKEQMEILSASLEKSITNEDMDLKELISILSDPNEIVLLEQLL